MSFTRKSEQATPKSFRGRTRFEHWYRDNQVYFITARVANRLPAFASEQAKQTFWTAFDKYTEQAGFTPWITCLLDNHYHTLGYLRVGLNLPKMIKGLHGCTAKLVNDLLEAGGIEAGGIHSTCPTCLNQRINPFWSENAHKTYFDGLLRNEEQARKTFRYIPRQPLRHGLIPAHASPDSYPHTRLRVPLEQALRRATQLNAYLQGVPYKRYQHP